MSYTPRPGRFICGATPNVELVGDNIWRTMEPIIYEDFQGTKYYAATGVLTDFSSIPWSLRWLMAKFGFRTPSTALAAGAVLHDLGYRQEWLTAISLGDSMNQYRRAFLGRDGFDELYCDCAATNDESRAVAPWQARLLYWGLKIGGGVSWRRYRNEEELHV